MPTLFLPGDRVRWTRGPLTGIVVGYHVYPDVGLGRLISFKDHEGRLCNEYPVYLRHMSPGGWLWVRSLLFWYMCRRMVDMAACRLGMRRYRSPITGLTLWGWRRRERSQPENPG